MSSLIAPCTSGSALRTAALLAVMLLGLASTGCEAAYPEVVVVNRSGETVLLRNPSFNGCVWEVVLAEGEATSPQTCLPGSDRVHFQMFDAAGWCIEQAEDGTVAGVCPCGGVGSSSGGTDPGLIDPVPRWFNYQTLVATPVGYGDFVVIEITRDGMEQDFSVPGPYGH